MFKKISLLLVLLSFSFPLFAFEKGGLTPCLASCCIGPRIGLEINEGSRMRDVEGLTLLSSVAGNMIFPPLGTIALYTMQGYQAFEAYNGKSMNEIRAEERLHGTAISANRTMEPGGPGPFLANCCLGPRVGLEMNDGRKVRALEWLQLVPFVGYIPRAMMGIEAYQGRTMTEIAKDEGLDE